MSIKCKLCSDRVEKIFFNKEDKIYYHCKKCKFIFLDNSFFPDPDTEKGRYLQHNNNLENPGYVEMFNEQMNDRYNYKYPPVYKQIKITLKHKDYNRVDVASIWLAKSLRQIFTENVLGPESPPIARIRNQFHKNILVKIPKQQSLAKTKEAIIKINNSFFSIKDFRSVKVILNVDNF